MQPASSSLGAVGYESYAGGMNAGARNHRELRPDQCSMLVNCDVRGGWLRPRAGYRVVQLRFTNKRLERTFQNGAAQGVCYYGGDVPRLIFAIGGQLLAFSPSDSTVRGHRTKVAQPFSPSAPIVHMTERSGYLVARDESGVPVIVDGGGMRVSDSANNEVYGGSVMADGWGYLLSASRDGSRLYISDHELDPTSAPLMFTEGLGYYLNAPHFSVPARLGRIRCIAFPNFIDSASGLGPAVVFGARGMMSYDISMPRPEWVKQPIAKMTLQTVGAVGPRCAFNATRDLFFRDQDGRIRSLRSAISDTKALTAERIDSEVRPLLRAENKALLTHSHGTFHDERALFTALPRSIFTRDGCRDVTHSGLLVLEANALSTLTQDNRVPSWAGLHTGLQTQLIASGDFDGEQRTFVLSMDRDGVRRLYEMTEQRFDVGLYRGKQVRKDIEWQVETRWFDWGKPMLHKKLDAAFVTLDDIEGSVAITGYYRTTSSSPWLPWFGGLRVGAHQGLVMGRDECGNCTMFEGRAAAEPKLSLPSLPKATNPATGADADRFLKIQFRFVLTGFAQLEEMSFEASQVESASKPAKPSKRRVEFCDHDVLSYSIS